MAAALVASACGTASQGKQQNHHSSASAACASTPNPRPHPARHRGTLRADIDGDGGRDDVFVAITPHAPPRCRYELIVRSVTRIWAAPIWQRGAEGSAWRAWAQLDLPDANVAARVGGRAVIAVTIWTGASKGFVGLYSIHNNRLARLHVSAASPPNTLAYGGAGFPVAVDCGRAGRIVAFSAWQAGGRWKVQQRFYRVRDTELAQTRVQTMTVRSISRFPRGLAGGQDVPFRSCAVARTQRSL